MRGLFARIIGPFLLVLMFWALGAMLGMEQVNGGYRYVPPEHERELLQKLCFDLAIAIIIAVAIREYIDRAREKRASIDIFREAFGAFFSNQLLQEAIDSIFSRRLVRGKFEVEYSFEPHASDAIVYMGTYAYYEVKNVSDISEELPIGLMLPNLMAKFPSDPAREKPKVERVEIDGHPFTADELERINATIALGDPSPRVNLGTRKLGARQTLRVSTWTRVIKLRNDVETVRMRLPTEGVSIRVNNGLGPDYSFGIEPIHAQSFGEPEFPGNGASRIWKVPSLFLPQNGWVLYWNDTAYNPSDGSRVATKTKTTVAA